MKTPSKLFLKNLFTIAIAVVYGLWAASYTGIVKRYTESCNQGSGKTIIVHFSRGTGNHTVSRVQRIYKTVISSNEIKVGKPAAIFFLYLFPNLLLLALIKNIRPATRLLHFKNQRYFLQLSVLRI